MKKLLAMTMILLLVLGSLGVTALAETPASVSVYVTIADEKGALALAQEPVTVTDADQDGALTIHDALYAAHEAKYEGGASAGYAASVSAYGLSLDKLWGTANGGSYGYCLHNASAWSLLDPIAAGDYVNAYVYTDLAAWSDTYCYFDVNTATAKVGDTLTLTLSAAGYDAEWNPVTLPVEGAVITVDGEETAYTTDAAGRVTITLNKSGVCVISAVSDTQTLVPPVCKVTVEGEDTTTAVVTTSTTTTETVADTTTVTSTDTTAAVASTDNDTYPQTGETAVPICGIMAVALTAVLVLTAKRRPAHEQ